MIKCPCYQVSHDLPTIFPLQPQRFCSSRYAIGFPCHGIPMPICSMYAIFTNICPCPKSPSFVGIPAPWFALMGYIMIYFMIYRIYLWIFYGYTYGLWILYNKTIIYMDIYMGWKKPRHGDRLVPALAHGCLVQRGSQVLGADRAAGSTGPESCCGTLG